MKFWKDLIAWLKEASKPVVESIHHMEDEVESLFENTYFILVSVHTPLIKENRIMTQLVQSVRVDQVLTLAAKNFDDIAGNAVTVSNPIVWTIDAPALATLVPSPDGTSVVITPTGALGTANVTSTVNSNPDASTPAVTVIGEAVVTFTAGLAVEVTLSATVADTTEDQTATAPAVTAPVAAAPAAVADTTTAPVAAAPAVDPNVSVAPAVDQTAAAPDATVVAPVVDATAPVAVDASTAAAQATDAAATAAVAPAAQ